MFIHNLNFLWSGSLNCVAFECILLGHQTVDPTNMPTNNQKNLVIAEICRDGTKRTEN